MEATLTDADGNAVDLTNATIKMHIKKNRSATVSTKNMAIVSAAAGTIKYEWQDGDTDESGIYLYEFEVTFPDSTILTIPEDGYEVLKIDRDLA